MQLGYRMEIVLHCTMGINVGSRGHSFIVKEYLTIFFLLYCSFYNFNMNGVNSHFLHWFDIVGVDKCLFNAFLLIFIIMQASFLNENQD